MRELQTGTAKRDRQEEEINKLYDRLQEAHEERDKYKKALEDIKKFCVETGTIMPLTDLMHIRRITKEALK